MILNQWVSPFADGHNPKVHPGGQPLVAFGGGGTATTPPTVRVVNWRTGELLLEAKGRAIHWLTDTVATWIEELGADRDQRWEFSVTSRTSRVTDDEPSLVAANDFTAGNGHWASYLDRGRRVVVDGRILPGGVPFRGVSIGGSELLTSVSDAFLQFFDLTTLVPTRVVQPSGTWNKWRNCHGLCFHGYWGDTFVASLTQTVSVDHTITPWHAEGVAVSTVAAGGRVWTATATEIAASTKERRVGVLVRPFGDTRCLAVWDVEMDTLDLGYMPGRLILAGASTTGALTIIELDEKAPIKPLAWPTSPDRPFLNSIAWGAYYEVSARPDYQLGGTLPFANCTFVTGPGDLQLAEGANRKVLVHDGNLDEVTKPGNVVGFMEVDEDENIEAINAVCRKMRTMWRKKFPTFKVPPVVGYLQPKQVAAMGGSFPQEYDILAPQMYFDLPASGPPRVDFFWWMSWWLERLPTDRLWMPTIQTFDRNFAWNASQMAVLANQMGQIISLARAYDFIIGYACFSVNRPGGIERWPELREALSRVGTVGRIGVFPSRWPYREASTVPTDPPQEKPMAEAEKKALIAQCARQAKFVAPYDIVEGARNLFKAHVLERDVQGGRLSDGAERYFGQYYYPAMAALQVEGGIPGSAEGWGGYSISALDEAKKGYDRDQRPQ